MTGSLNDNATKEGTLTRHGESGHWESIINSLFNKTIT
jgi:hypothetical protein